MDRPDLSSSVRRYKAYVNPLGTTQLHLRNPIVVALWSALFPGFGHMLLSKYFRGYLLFVCELLINYKAHINLAILYSFTGRFQIAKDVLVLNWVYFYVPIFLFAIFDAYRSTVDINHIYILASREDANVKSLNMSLIEVNYLDRRIPWVAAMFSAFTPGLGQLYIHRIPTSIVLLGLTITIDYNANLFPAIHYTLLGQISYATSIINQQWFLNVFSMHFFAIYDAYVNAVENNKLFHWEQAKYLKNDYQDKQFPLPFQAKENVDG